MRIYTGRPPWASNPYLRRGMGDTASIQSQISAAAASAGVPAAVALAVASKESGYNQAAVGTSGELGVFQLMPATAAGLGVNASDLEQNIQGGISYLAQLYKQFGNWTQALEAYNGGPGNVTKGTVSTAAQNYASSILSNLNLTSGSSDTSTASDTVWGISDLWSSQDSMGSDGTGIDYTAIELVLAAALAAGVIVWALH